MQLISVDLENNGMYLDDATGSDKSSIDHVATLVAFFARLRLHRLKLFPNETLIGAARVDFPGYVNSKDGVHLNDGIPTTVTRKPMSTDIKHLHSLLCSVNYYHKFLPNMARPIRPTMAPFKKGARFDFTSAIMVDVFGAFLAKFVQQLLRISSV